eukprot:TRINITY_DN11680_c0_g1_i1.p1 TRINITY_DN11680_c0_g1~~TRINITY_DN11680_c0_g1_i1.p1  ORF type:complete len:159 (+),score=54.21 TRINITY_DN11680_c0_g1_i1:45-521(+)
MIVFVFFFFKQKTAYEMQRGLVGSEMCIRDRYMGAGAFTDVFQTMFRQGSIVKMLGEMRSETKTRFDKLESCHTEHSKALMDLNVEIKEHSKILEEHSKALAEVKINIKEHSKALAEVKINIKENGKALEEVKSDVNCLLYTSPSPRDLSTSRMPSSA